MGTKKYIIKLGKKEKEYLEKYIKKGKRSARAINRARVLLSANEQKKDEEIANILGLSKPTIYTCISCKNKKQKTNFMV